LENQFYRVVLDAESGAVKSIFDKELNKELVNTSSTYRFDQYLYVTGGDQSPNRLLEYSANWPIPELTIHNAGGGHLVSITNEPFGMAARLESSGVNTPRIETEIILFNGQKKIEFINHVRKTEVYSKEGIYFAFPLAMDQPQFRYEIQNGFVNPAHDQLPGAGKEWFSVQHWVAADQDGVTEGIIPVDASLITLGDIVRGTWPREFGQRPGTIFSQVMTSGSNLEPANLSRLGREEMSPLEVDQITSQDKAVNSPRPLDAAQASFLKVDQPDVALVTWKAAEDGKGTILRFLELSGKPAGVNAETPLLNVQGAWMADALERNQGPLATSPHGFRFSVKPFQIVTGRVEGTSAIK
jgi:alpha-mannosidase